MSGGEEWTNQDGPALGAASRRAGQIDDAQTPAERRRAWARFVPSALIALAEDALRRWAAILALLASVGVALAAATSEGSGLVITGVVAGVAGVILVIVALVRWSFGRQWAVFLVVLGVQALLITAFSQAG